MGGQKINMFILSNDICCIFQWMSQHSSLYHLGHFRKSHIG